MLNQFGVIKVVDFVTRVSDEESPDFVPPAERIAVFDNDGTLWSEQPYYFQLDYALYFIKKEGPNHPEWTKNPVLKSVLGGDLKAVMDSGEKGLMEIIMTAHAGMTEDEFTAQVKNWLANAKHPNTGKTSVFNELTGLNQQVGNYPGITVEKKIGFCKLTSKIKAIIFVHVIYKSFQLNIFNHNSLKFLLKPAIIYLHLQVLRYRRLPQPLNIFLYLPSLPAPLLPQQMCFPAKEWLLSTEWLRNHPFQASSYPSKQRRLLYLLLIFLKLLLRLNTTNNQRILL